MARKKFVAFASVHNRCRSLLAEAYLRRHGSQYFEALSFGVSPDRLHHLAYQVLQRRGFNTNHYFSKAYEVVERQGFDILVAMNPDVLKKLPDFPQNFDTVVWDIEDPIKPGLDEAAIIRKIEAVADEIEQKVKELIAEKKPAELATA